MNLTLDIFWFTDEEQKLHDAGIEVKTKVKDAITKEVTFYNIDHIHSTESGFCQIFSGGEDFIANESYRSVKKKIEDRMFPIFGN